MMKRIKPEPPTAYPDQADTSIAAVLPAGPLAVQHFGLSMNRFEPPKRHDVVTIPIIWVAVVLSILVHLTALVWLQRSRLLTTEAREPGRTSALTVRLAPRTSQVANAAAVAPPPQHPAQPALRAAIRPRHETPVRPRPVTPKLPPPPLIALDKPAPLPLEPPPASEPSRAPAPVAQAAPLPPAPAEDLSAYIEARRRARGEASAPSAATSVNTAGDSDLERRNRIVAANLGLNRTPTFGHDPRNAGGIFEIRALHYDDAEFYFFGFDKDIGRNAKQLIEVRKGDNSDIRIAVVRKMIGIIRENISGDFLWVSHRMGRQVTLSARPGDNAGLEDFIMRDVFPDARLP